MRLVWVVIPLILFGIVGVQESFARGDSPRYSIILADIEGNVSMPPSLGEKNFLRFDSLGFGNQGMPLEATISIVCGLNEMVLYDETKLLNITSSEVIIDSFTSKFSGDYTITMMAEGIQPISIMFSIQGSIEDRCDSEFIKNLPPMKQIEHGVKLNEIICKENMQLIFKPNNSPACVKLETAEKLIERGWAKHISDVSLDQSVDVTCTTKLDQEKRTYSVRYNINNAQITNAEKNDSSSLILSISPVSDGSLYVELPRGLIDALRGHDLQDDIFFVLLDGEEVEYVELKTTDEFRLLQIDFEHTTNEIRIVGPLPLPILDTINTCD